MKNTHKWSQEVTESHALGLEEGVFTWKDPKNIAKSLKNAALESKGRKSSPLKSSMSMLNFYINRAGETLDQEQKEILEQAKIELRKLFGE